MNIQSVKDEIKVTVKMYLSKDANGVYDVAGARQRPVLIIGAPGIGKTAIVRQVAEEMHLGFVSYTITHHTRQSAIGLPFVKEKTFQGETYSATEYTLSEIVDSVYTAIEKQGKREGILFIDEINCVSETLAPAMLELLQNKKFGPHKIPEGWVLVAAGNPPEYNKSVKEFDIVTLDRVKRVVAEPDFEVWKRYAMDQGVHTAVLYYLGLKPQSLFSVEKTVDGVAFVTPRGWEDLSVALTMYEKMGVEVTRGLVEEYVQNTEIATEFFRCYLLYVKYNKQYAVSEILAGDTAKADALSLSSAPFDERLAVTEVLSGGVNALCLAYKDALSYERAVKPLYSTLSQTGEEEGRLYLTQRAEELKTTLRDGASGDKKQLLSALNRLLSSADAFAEAEKVYEEAEQNALICKDSAKRGVENALAFLENTFGKGQEMVAFLVGVVASPAFIAFLSRNPLPTFMEYNKLLLTGNQNRQLLLDIEKLNQN